MLPPPAITARFDVVAEDVRHASCRWSVLAVRDTNRLLDAITPEQFAADGRLPYWADLWASSIALAGDLRARPALAGARILELGCGLGLAGIAAAQAGASVTITDYEEDALEFARFNARANLTDEELSRVTLRLLDWRAPRPGGRYDLIVGADIVYDRADFAPLVALVRARLRAGGTLLLADPDRETGREFLRLASAEGFALCHRSVGVDRKGKTVNVALSELVLKEAP